MEEQSHKENTFRLFEGEGFHFLRHVNISNITNTLRNPTGDGFKPCKNNRKRIGKESKRFRGNFKSRKGISEANKHRDTVLGRQIYK